MIKIAFIVPPFLGHFHPTLSIGEELIRNGYKVYWIAMPEGFQHVIPEGGHFLKIKEYSSTATGIINFGMESLQGLYEDILVPINKFMYDEIKPYILSEGFDVIITDHQAFVGAILAHEFNIPYITSVTAPAAIERSKEFPEVINFERNQIVKLQQYFGINKTEPLVCASPLTLVYSTTQFLQSENFPLNYQFVGPSIKNRIEHYIQIKEIDQIEPSKPKILVTIGSILKLDQTLVDKMIEAFKDENVSIILVADPGIKDEWPSNFFVYPYIPQLKVLEKVNAVICHAGHNTVCEALRFGLPLITLPMVNDQSYIATKVCKCGAGIRLKYKRLKSHHLKNSVQELLSNPTYRAAAQRIKESFEEAGGSRRASELIEQFMIQSRILTPNN